MISFYIFYCKTKHENIIFFFFLDFIWNLKNTKKMKLMREIKRKSEMKENKK